MERLYWDRARPNSTEGWRHLTNSVQESQGAPEQPENAIHCIAFNGAGRLLGWYDKLSDWRVRSAMGAIGQRRTGGQRMGKVPTVGAVTPDFELPDSTGAPRRLSELLSQGPVVLLFFRGHW